MFGDATVARRKAATTPRKRRQVNRPLMPVVGSPTERADYKIVSGHCDQTRARPEVQRSLGDGGRRHRLSPMSCSAICSNAGPVLITKTVVPTQNAVPADHSQPQRIRMYRLSDRDKWVTGSRCRSGRSGGFLTWIFTAIRSRHRFVYPAFEQMTARDRSERVRVRNTWRSRDTVNAVLHCERDRVKVVRVEDGVCAIVAHAVGRLHFPRTVVVAVAGFDSLKIKVHGRSPSDVNGSMNDRLLASDRGARSRIALAPPSKRARDQGLVYCDFATAGTHPRNQPCRPRHVLPVVARGRANAHANTTINSRIDRAVDVRVRVQ
jgi:hypothetical protein